MRNCCFGSCGGTVLRRSGRRVAEAGEMAEAMAGPAWDVVLCDHVLPRFGMREALELARRSDADVPFVIVSGRIDEETVGRGDEGRGRRTACARRTWRGWGAILERELRETGPPPGSEGPPKERCKLAPNGTRGWFRLLTRASAAWTGIRGFPSPTRACGRCSGIRRRSRWGGGVSDFLFPEDLEDHRRRLLSRRPGQPERLRAPAQAQGTGRRAGRSPPSRPCAIPKGGSKALTRCSRT